MRIKITFLNPEKETYLPINTNYYLVKLINSLSYEYRRYLNSLLPGNSNRGIFNFYTFSQLVIPARKIEDFKIGILSSEFHWYISSPFYQFLGILAKEFRIRRTVRIATRWFEISQVNFIGSPVFEHSEGRFTCLSPIAVYRQNSNSAYSSSTYFSSEYLLPEDRDYLANIEQDLVHKFNLIKGTSKHHLDIDVKYDLNYIRKKNNRITKVITLENGNDLKERVRGVLAPLQIKADPDVLQLIYDSGLGQLNNLGFGMLETVHR